MPKFRLCFAGTPAFAADHLSCLIAQKQDIAAVYTQPDRPAGRGKRLQASPVKQRAQEHGLLIKQPASLRSADSQQEFRELEPDLLVVVAYGLILPQEILDIPRFGCINVHASLLPRWRGAAPIERAILAGDDVTGVTIMQMDAGLDTGPMLHTSATEILPGDDRESLTNKLSELGQDALIYTLNNFLQLQKDAQTQDESQSTYAAKLEKHESLIDWSQPADVANRVIRAGVGRFPAFSFIEQNRLRLLKARVMDADQNKPPGTVISVDKQGVVVACGNGSLLIEQIQLPGKKPCWIRDYLNSNPTLLLAGQRFSDSEKP